MAKSLGRRVPTDWNHYDKYPLRLAPTPPRDTPVVLGINWYENFDSPEQASNGLWWIGKSNNLGDVLGGHAVCIKPSSRIDWPVWWEFYDQGWDGACVGFSSSHMMTLMNRRRYNARWLWERAKEVDEWSDTNPGDDEGTSVRAACQVLQGTGHVRWNRNQEEDYWYDREYYKANPDDGIKTYRWASTVDEILEVCGNKDLYVHRDGVPILNSWGKDYPHYTWLPLDVLQTLLNEEGEAAVVTDR